MDRLSWADDLMTVAYWSPRRHFRRTLSSFSQWLSISGQGLSPFLVVDSWLVNPLSTWWIFRFQNISSAIQPSLNSMCKCFVSFSLSVLHVWNEWSSTLKHPGILFKLFRWSLSEMKNARNKWEGRSWWWITTLRNIVICNSLNALFAIYIYWKLILPHISSFSMTDHW